MPDPRDHDCRDAYAEDLRRTGFSGNGLLREKSPAPVFYNPLLSALPADICGEGRPGRQDDEVSFGIPAVDHQLNYSGLVEFPVDAGEQQVRDAVEHGL